MVVARPVRVGVTVVGACIATACASTDYDAKLKHRASFDLSCPQRELRLRELDNSNVMGVEGCGQRATYVWVEAKDAWVMNTASAPRSE